MKPKTFYTILFAFVLTLIFVSAAIFISIEHSKSIDDSMYEDESSEAFEGEVYSDSLDIYLEEQVGGI